MLKKLFKHEFRAMAKGNALMYLLVAVFTFLVILYAETNDLVRGRLDSLWLKRVSAVLGGFIGMGYFLVLVVVNLLTLVYLIYRFYRTMVADEGYLTHTLPVTTGQLIFTKAVTAFCFQIFSFLVSLFSIVFVIAVRGGFGEIVSAVREVLGEFSRYIGFHFITFFVLLLLLVIGVGMFGILKYYFCLSMGNLFNSHKLLGSVGIYLAFNIVMGIVKTILSVAGIYAGYERADRLAESFAEKDLSDAAKLSEIFGFIDGYLFIGVLLAVLGCGLLFFVSRYLLKHKLNLA